MKRVFLLILAGTYPFLCSIAHAETNPAQSVFKIYSYSYDEITDSYDIAKYGSAVLSKNNLIYTNAHVVLDEKGKPYGRYRVCKTENFKEPPKCFSIGELAYYDEKNDLALLKVGNPGVTGTEQMKKDLNIGDTVKVYGYPQIGWDTITYTEGKISGFENGLYKIDANIDSGSSGGGVFDKDGNLIGVAVSIKSDSSTIGYVVPSQKISDFLSKKGSITVYREPVDKDFVTYDRRFRTLSDSKNFVSPGVSLNGIRTAGYRLKNYDIDKQGNFFGAEFWNADNSVKIILINFQFSRKKGGVSLVDVLKKADKSSETITKGLDVKKIRTVNFKLGNREAAAILMNSEKIHVAQIYVHAGGSTVIQALVTSKDEAWLTKALSYLKKKMAVKELPEVRGERLWSIMVDNLFSADDSVCIVRSIAWGSVFFPDTSDISASLKTWQYEDGKLEDYSFESYFQERYESLKDEEYLNEAKVLKTESGEPYGYFFMRYNMDKETGEDKKLPPYYVYAFFFEKTAKGMNFNVISFTFTKPESKKIIDEFLKRISTGSRKLPFPEGDIIVGKDFVPVPEFDLTYPAVPPKKQ